MRAIERRVGAAPARLIRFAGTALLCMLLSPYAAFLAFFIAAGLAGRGARWLTTNGHRLLAS